MGDPDHARAATMTCAAVAAIQVQVERQCDGTGPAAWSAIGRNPVPVHQPDPTSGSVSPVRLSRARLAWAVTESVFAAIVVFLAELGAGHKHQSLPCSGCFGLGRGEGPHCLFKRPAYPSAATQPDGRPAGCHGRVRVTRDMPPRRRSASRSCRTGTDRQSFVTVVAPSASCSATPTTPSYSRRLSARPEA